MKIWEATRGKELFTLEGHGGHIQTVAFRPDGKRLASASQDETIRIWGRPGD